MKINLIPSPKHVGILAQGYDFDTGVWKGIDPAKGFGGVWGKVDQACPASFGPYGSDTQDF